MEALKTHTTYDGVLTCEDHTLCLCHYQQGVGLEYRHVVVGDMCGYMLLACSGKRHVWMHVVSM